MSYITFDFKCTKCDTVDSRMVKRKDMDNQTCDRAGTLFPCLGTMYKLPANTRTTFRFADEKLKR